MNRVARYGFYERTNLDILMYSDRVVWIQEILQLHMCIIDCISPLSELQEEISYLIELVRQVVLSEVESIRFGKDLQLLAIPNMLKYFMSINSPFSNSC